MRETYANPRVESVTLVSVDQPTRIVRGLVLVRAPLFTDFRYGDRMRAEGTRSVQAPANTGDFDYREYLAVRTSIPPCRARP
jgi:hypothetical protein